jgi:ABC-type branched-subunit amino acid transport system substrate-binding protein
MVKKNFITILITGLSFLFMAYLFSLEKEPTEIRLGASLPLSGINQNLGKEITIGADIYFKATNARGGIRGKKIHFLYYDDKYEPEITQVNMRRLIEQDKVFALFDFVGTPTIKYVFSTIKESGIPFIAPYTGAAFLRDPQINNIINLRSSYQEEIDALIGYLIQERNITRISIFYQNDEYGKEGYIATLNVLKKNHLQLVSEGTYRRNTLFIKQAIYDIDARQTEAIILVGAYKPTARFIKAARKNGFDHTIFCPISFVNADALMRELGGASQNILFSQTVPSYTQNNTNAKTYRKLLRQYYPEHTPTFASYESFLAAKIVVEALRENRGKITPKNFLYQLKHLQIQTLDGLEIHYKNSQLLNKVYLSEYKNGAFHLIGTQP